MAREAGWAWFEALTLGDLAEAAVAFRRADEAEEKARELLRFARRTDDRHGTIRALALLARAAALRGDDERALRLWASVEAVEEPPGRFGRFDRAEYAAAMPDLPRPAPLPLDQAVALALAD